MSPPLTRLLFAALVAAACAPAARSQPAVWTAAEAPPPSIRLHPEAGTERPGGRAPAPHYVRLDRSVLSAAVAEARRGGRPSLSFEVAPGVRVQSTAVWTERRSADGLTWSGTVAGDPLGHVLLTVVGAAAAGHIATGGRSYSIGHAGGNWQVVYEVDPAALGVPCHVVEGEGEEAGGYLGGGTPSEWPPQKSTGAPDTVGVMLLYTAAVREAVGEAGVAALLQGSIDSANDVLIRSEVAGRFAMVHAREIPILDPDLVEDALDALRYLWRWYDGVLDEIHAWRWEHEAQLVSLFTELPGYCGAGRVPSRLERDFVLINGFNVVRRSCAISNFSFAHEIGHNLGLLHDPYVSQGNGPFPFGHGYVSLAGAPGNHFRTVMAYEVECTESGAECPRVPYFSNASLMLGRYPLGEPELSDAARVLAASVPFTASLEMVGGIAPDIYIETLEDTPKAIAPSNDAVEVSVVVPPAHGTASAESGTTILYQPDLDYHGADSLTYRARGRYENWSFGVVRINVVSVPDPPDLVAPMDGEAIDLNAMEGPLEVQWTELDHSDSPESRAAALEAHWELRVVHVYQHTYRIYAGDTTRLRVSAAELDDVLRAAGVPPGDRIRVDHWVSVSDGERSAAGPSRRLYVRRLEQADASDDDSEEGEEALPLATTLRAVYPNPTREDLTMEVGVPTKEVARITVYDVVGRPVRTVEVALEAGFNQWRLDLRSLPAGVYLYRIETKGETFRGRVTVL